MNEKDQEIEETLSEDIEVATPGQLLREAREAAQLSVEDISSKLHLKVSLINAIEKNNFDEISSITFARGYLKAYAKLLDVNEADILAAFEHYITAEQQQTQMQTFSNRKGKKKLDSWLTILTLLLLVGIVAAVAVWYVRNQPAVPEPVANDVSISSEQQNSAGRSPKTNSGLTNTNTTQINTNTTQTKTEANGDNLSPAGELLEPETTEQIESAQEVEPKTAPQTEQDSARVQTASEQHQQLNVQTNESLSNELDDESRIEQSQSTNTQSTGNSAGYENDQNDLSQKEIAQNEIAQNQTEQSETAQSADAQQQNITVEQAEQQDKLQTEQQETVVTAHLELRFEDSCWINIEDATGERVAIGTKVKGHYTSVHGVPPFTIKLGKPDVVNIWLDGQPREIPYYPKGSIANFELAAN